MYLDRASSICNQRNKCLYISIQFELLMVFISKQPPITIIINDVSYEHADKLNQCFYYCCLAEKTMTMKVHDRTSC